MLVGKGVVEVSDEGWGKGLGVTLDVGESVPVFLSIDARAFERVLGCLFWNALSFTASGSVQVAVAWSEREGLEVAVSDTGRGISSDQEAYIFWAFGRGGRPTSPVPTSARGTRLSGAPAVAIDHGR